MKVDLFSEKGDSILRICIVFLILIGSIFSSCQQETAKDNRPNIIIVLTDDQGYGDVGYNGNPIIQTPNLDKFAAENVQFSQFYVSPVCTPTRAALMTGREPFRLHITWVGQPLHPEELTLAEHLKTAGYTTACFGKWGNLGTHFPLRAIDRGFDEAVVHLKGQFSPPHNKTTYFDPILYHNGIEKQYQGYCNDIWFDEAEKFIEKNQNRPFFIYLPTNLPHLPAQVPESYYEQYLGKVAHDQIARSYGMITHVDERFRRMLNKLETLGLRENTIVIFLSDNGPSWDQEKIFMAGLRGHKGWVYEGGIRVPTIMSWPAGFKHAQKIDRIASQLDVMPTLLDAAGIETPAGVHFDGVSLMPLLRGDSENWPDRYLFSQGYPTAEPQIRRCFMVRNQQYKLVQQVGFKDESGKMVGSQPIPEDDFKYELFDMTIDPGEINDISAYHPEIVHEMTQAYENWYADVTQNPGFTWERAVVYVGAPQQPVVRISSYGGRRVNVVSPGPYRITMKPFGKIKWAPGDVWKGGPFKAKSNGEAFFEMGHISLIKDIETGAADCVFEQVILPEGMNHFKFRFEINGEKVHSVRDEDGDRLGPVHVTFELL